VGLHAALLCGACVATILTGAAALADLPVVVSAVCGTAAWLLVMPCVWLARAPRRQDGFGEEEDDSDDGGSPSPLWPSAPPAPGDLPGGGLWSPARPPVAAAWTAPEPAPVAAATALAEHGPAHRRRLQRPRRVRADHRSIVHLTGAGEHTGRRRRASLRLRLRRRLERRRAARV
jgi:hypothetical protein